MSFIVWIVFTGLHVLGHLPSCRARFEPAASRRGPGTTTAPARRAGALITLAGALVGGLVLALLVESQFGAWAHFHHHLH